MEFKIHESGNTRIAELISAGMVVQNAQDAVDILGNLYYQDLDRVILHEKNITPDFFDLKTGIAGDVLQKFSNYRVRLAIVGAFENFQSKSVRDFIFESNKSGHINFVSTPEQALQVLSK